MRFVFLAVLASVTACGSSTTSPSVAQVNAAGNYTGPFTVNSSRSVYTGSLSVTQNGTNVAGKLATSGGRTGDFAGTIAGTQISGTFTFTDTCGGSATTSATINGTQLAGRYTSTDCTGTDGGTFTLTRQ